MMEEREKAKMAEQLRIKQEEEHKKIMVKYMK